MSDANKCVAEGFRTRPRIIFVNRYFAPDVSATSQILSDLAFHLAQENEEVHVVCGDGSYSGISSLSQEETIRGVKVHRIPDGRFGRRNLGRRALDYLILYASLRRRLVRLLQPGDILVIKTDPPLLMVPLEGLARKRGVICVPWLQDLYPEVATALGVPFVQGPIAKTLTHLRDSSLKKAQRIVAIGDRMRGYLISRGIDPSSVSVIPNWSDGAVIVPVPRAENPLRTEWNLHEKFVVGYSGNLGRAHEFTTLITAAEQFRGRDDIAFLFVGGGHHVDALKAEAKSRGIEDLFSFQPYQALERLAQSLSVPDVHWLSLKAELEGLIVPSKFYGIAAAGRAVINVGARDGEIAALVSRFQCGVTVEPGDSGGMASVISNFITNPADLNTMGRNGRKMLVDNFSKEQAMARWKTLLNLCDN